MVEKKPKLNIAKLSVVQISPKIQSITNLPALKGIKGTQAEFEIVLVPLFNIEANAIKIELEITIDIKKDEEHYPKVAQFAFDFFYEYENLIDLQDGEGELISDIFLTCSNLSYSTLRGIIYSKSAKTCIEDVLLPVVTGSELTKGLVKK